VLTYNPCSKLRHKVLLCSFSAQIASSLSAQRLSHLKYSPVSPLLHHGPFSTELWHRLHTFQWVPCRLESQVLREDNEENIFQVYGECPTTFSVVTLLQACSALLSYLFPESTLLFPSHSTSVKYFVFSVSNVIIFLI